MNEFDDRARQWDNNIIHIERSEAIAAMLKSKLPEKHPIKALEYGAGTGLLSFQLMDKFDDIVLMDNSQEMIKVCLEKKEYYNASHIRPVWIDLEYNDFNEKFDVIYCQMVLHHVDNTEVILDKFQTMLNPGGILAIADLYTEDGSFHGPEVKVHFGFDPDELIGKLNQLGFHHGEYKTCFVVKRPNGFEYPVFLLTSEKN
jgi:2-polyprenyl-3-methyl-5-hydroxy-6-metoxy-1,4-benzoquinol methylase